MRERKLEELLHKVKDEDEKNYELCRLHHHPAHCHACIYINFTYTFVAIKGLDLELCGH